MLIFLLSRNLQIPMFLYYKMSKHSVINIYNNLGPNMPSRWTPNSNLIKTKFIVLSVDPVLISRYILPLLYMSRLTKFFLLYFKFLTLRSTRMLGNELRLLTNSSKVTTLLPNSKPFKGPINLLIRFRIPFIFVQYPLGQQWVLGTYRLVNLVFGLYKLQRMYKLSLLN